MAGNKRGSASEDRRWDASTATRHTDGAGLYLITRVRQPGLAWILWLRFELYVNLAQMAALEV